MADNQDYYALLCVNKTASADEINRAYRRLAKKYHPDINKDPKAPAMFEKITKAYEVLKDPQKRAAYDQFGSGAFDENGNAGFNANNFAGFGNGGFDSSDFGDIFSQFFGGGNRRANRQQSNGATKGEDAFMRMRISFMDAINGRQVQMPYDYESVCDQCRGKGAVNPGDVQTCPNCNGSGHVVQNQRTLFGTFQTQTTCPRCHGKGTIIIQPCTKCHGQGYTRVKTTLNINIPAGINEGQQLRVPGKGNRGFNGGPNGDLFIEMVVDKDKAFSREGNDIHLKVKIALVTAILGGTIEVPTVYGMTDLTIPAGTQPQTTLVLRGKGVKSLNGRTGSEYVHIVIQIPTRLSEEEKELYDQLALINHKKSGKKDIFSRLFHNKD